jgi:hypothetical protein
LLIGFSDHTLVHPAAVAILEHSNTEDLDCRPAAAPDSVLDYEGPNRIAAFRLAGHYTCHRRVFSADEREPYIGRALEAQVGEAKRVAMNVKRKIAGMDVAPIAITVDGVDEEKLGTMIASIYRNELTTVLGPGHVRRNAIPDEETTGPQLKIHVRRVDIEEKMTDVRLRVPNKHGAGEWQEI